jgi:hypothetical protein
MNRGRNMKRKSSTFMRMQRVASGTGELPAVSNTPADPAQEIGAIIAELSSHGIATLLVQARTIRDDERRRGARPPIMFLSLRDFVARVQEAADGAITGVFGNKVFIASLYRLFEERGEASGCSIADFKDRLMTAYRAGLLALERCDSLEPTNTNVMRSEIQHLGGKYHFVVRKGR